MRLVVGGGAVVAGLCHLHRFGNHGVAQLLDAEHHGIGDVDRVLARLLGNGQCHGRVFAAAVLLCQTMPDVVAAGPRTILNVGDIFHEDGFAGMHTHHQISDFACLLQKRTGFDGNTLVASDQLTHWQTQIGRLQRVAQVGHRAAATSHAHRVNAHHHGTAGAANGLHLARAGHALELGFDAVCHAFEFERVRVRALAEQRQTDDGYVVDALGLDDGLHHAQAARQPVGVGAQGIVQTHQRFSARHADLELHRHDGQTRTRHRHHVLGARHLREHLLGRYRHHLLHIGHGSAGEGDQHIGHRDIDLWLFFTRCHQHGKAAQQQGQQGQQRRDVRTLEGRCDAARNSHGSGLAHFSAPWPRLVGPLLPSRPFPHH